MKKVTLAGLVCFVLAAPAVAWGQIYTCTAPDGTRVFSDQRCGADAKVVPGIGAARKRTTATKPTTPAAQPAVKSGAELEALSARCDAGDTQACNDWTRSGGPASLKANERKLEQDCMAGQLAACEERYCRDGATRDCRERVRETAPASGNDWYLRTTGKRQPDGSTEYAVRCMPEGDLTIADVAISCAAKAGPERCGIAQSAHYGPSMSEVAARQCRSKH